MAFTIAGVTGRRFSTAAWCRTSTQSQKPESAQTRPQAIFRPAIFKERFNTIERVFGWEDKFRRLLLRFERISELHYAFKTLAYAMINLRHFC